MLNNVEVNGSISGNIKATTLMDQCIGGISYNTDPELMFIPDTIVHNTITVTVMIIGTKSD